MSMGFFIRSILLPVLFVVFLTFNDPNIWVNSFNTVKNTAGVRLGLVSQEIAVAGTGSMYPTFPKGEEGKTNEELAEQIVATPGMQAYPTGFKLFGRNFFSYKLKKGDIVSFNNDKVAKITEELHGSAGGFIKRIVAVGGDRIKIEDGIFYVNGDPQKEPYVARARSTFGSPDFPECTEKVVPKGKLFVMGDNRKGSLDSRFELGFIDEFDVDHVIPFEKQVGELDKNWHNPDRDLAEEAKIKTDQARFIELLNQKRGQNRVSKLSYNSKLEASARARGGTILKYNDFSPEATRSGYTMEKAMSEAGYSNIVRGEIPVQGYYEAQELVDYFFEFPDSKKFLLNKDYDDIGLSEVEGKINGCPTKVVVLHIGGYVPPNYKTEDIESWKKGVDDIEKVMPGWRELKNYPKVNQGKLDELLRDMETLQGIYRRIYDRMKASLWLTEEDKSLIKQSESLNDKVLILQKELNDQVSSN